MFGTTIDKLQKNSDKIVSVFTKTIQDLTAVNAEVDTNIATREAEIKRIEEEKANLTSIKDKNSAMITKLNKLFE
jgi:hypothetical protein